MKKILSWIIITGIVLSLCACRAAGPDAGNTGPTALAGSQPDATLPAITTVPTETTENTVPSAPKELVSEVREDGLTYLPWLWHYHEINKPGLQIYFNLSEDLYPGMKITIDVSVSMGQLRSIEKWYGLTVEGYENRVLFWSLDSMFEYEPEESEFTESGGSVFAEVVIRADGHIVGYGIQEFGTEEGEWFATMRTETVCFPMINGQLQDVSEEYVIEKLAERKQIVTPCNMEEKKAEYQAYWEAY